MRVPTSLADYQAVKGTTFRAVGDPLPGHPFLLAEVKVDHDSPQQLAYSLFFTAPAPLLNQQIRHFQHDQLGELHLFLVPIAHAADGFRYQAAFNLLKPATVSA